MDRGLGDDGAVADMPWASVFSPTANARALGAIQAEGFRAASQLVDRFVRAATVGDTQPASGDPPGPNGAGQSDLERLTRAWWAMFGQFLLGAAPGSLPGAGGAGSLTFGQSAAGGMVTLEGTGPGWVSTEVWLHNNTHNDFGEVSLHCSALVAHTGHVIAASAAVCDPDPVPVPARTSRGVQLRVQLAPFDPPGIYRGTLLATGQPDLWLPVALTVRPPAP
ncbi:hypothetical protein [Mycobacterium sp. ST-F2]|uniref:hypothetical protein n=1 Tax=Mycobacterium sp. ST-F2 TaxID=1490484 RepID=UPI000AA5BB88|nr:hypothetical protein [Mycobacterium sp. ST-F2]